MMLTFCLLTPEMYTHSPSDPLRFPLAIPPSRFLLLFHSSLREWSDAARLRYARTRRVHKFPCPRETDIYRRRQVTVKRCTHGKDGNACPTTKRNETAGDDDDDGNPDDGERETDRNGPSWGGPRMARQRKTKRDLPPPHH